MPCVCYTTAISNADGQCDVFDWKDIVAISAGEVNSFGLKSDGSVVSAGYNEYYYLSHFLELGVEDFEERWQDIVSISAGYDHMIGLKSDGTVIADGVNEDGQCDISKYENLSIAAMQSELSPEISTAEGVRSGNLGKNLKWTWYDDGVLNISGQGGLNSMEGLPEFAQTDVKKVKIEDGVTSICDSAFNGWYINEVELADTIQSIGTYAFSGCLGLHSIKIPQGVTIIDEGTFMYCEYLQKVKLPDSVRYIGDGAFESCISLVGLIIPENVTVIGDYAFSECDNLTEMIIPDKVQSIGANAFYYCSSLETVKLPENLHRIEDGTFSCCGSLCEITIPESVSNIGEAAFFGCGSLPGVTISRYCDLEEGAFDAGTQINYYY